MGMYQGVNASEGIGIGTVMVAVDPDLTFEPHEVADSAAEKERYQSALSVFCEKTQAQADHMKETVGEAEAEIMSGHIVLAQDPGMTDAINAAIDGGTCAEQALMDTSTMFENMFLSMDDEMFRLRAADIADIRTGILAELLGKEVVDACGFIKKIFLPVQCKPAFYLLAVLIIIGLSFFCFKAVFGRSLYICCRCMYSCSGCKEHQNKKKSPEFPFSA